jgi:hypothetical protein
MSSRYALCSLRVPAVLLALSLTAAACGGDPEGAEDPDAQATANPTVLSVASPFSGESITGALPKHPVMVVKMDNSGSSSPQIGLSGADMIVEELVEGGITRLALVFWTQTPKNVGPVRSMRATDIGVVLPAHGVLVAAGGAPQTRSRVAKAEIDTYGEGDSGFYRDSSRYAPYNLFVHLNELAKSIKTKEASVPESYLPFGDEPLPVGRRAKRIDAWFSGASVTRWLYRDGGYVNTNSNGLASDQYLPQTVLVLKVRVGDAGYLDPARNPVPETYFTGKGEALIFHGGTMVKATWTKAGYDAPVRLSTADGDLELPVGKVWIELVPAATGRVDVAKR